MNALECVGVFVPVCSLKTEGTAPQTQGWTLETPITKHQVFFYSSKLNLYLSHSSKALCLTSHTYINIFIHWTVTVTSISELQDFTGLVMDILAFTSVVNKTPCYSFIVQLLWWIYSIRRTDGERQTVWGGEIYKTSCIINANFTLSQLYTSLKQPISFCV